MKKKMVSVFLTAAMISTMLAGCGSSSAQSSAAATSAGAAEKSTAAAASSTASSSKGAKAKLTVAYRDPDDQGDENYMYKWIMQSYNAWDKKD